jgi:hypothetical protein
MSGKPNKQIEPPTRAALLLLNVLTSRKNRRGEHRSSADFAPQNLSPQGENPASPLLKIRNSLNFGGRAMLAPTDTAARFLHDK